MAIVAYTDAKAPQNLSPARIISPSHSGPGCFTHPEGVGPVTRNGRWTSQYGRCRRCGFPVRVSLRHTPDAAWIEELRRRLETSFQRTCRISERLRAGLKAYTVGRGLCSMQ